MKDINLYAEGIRARICTMDLPDMVLVTAVDVAPEHRGHGYARSMMRTLCEQADAEGITLCLEVAPDGTEGSLDFEQLSSFYAGFGFGFTDNGMVRLPRG